MQRINSNKIYDKIKIYNPELEVLNIKDINNLKTEVLVRCSNCGSEFYAKISNIIKDDFCFRKYCSCNNKYKRISMQSMFLYYYVKKYFEDCLFEYKIENKSFDLYIPSKNTAIEFDGRAHFNLSIEKYNSKNDICVKNKVNLIRVIDSYVYTSNFKSSEFIKIIKFGGLNLRDDIKPVNYKYYTFNIKQVLHDIDNGFSVEKPYTKESLAKFDVNINRDILDILKFKRSLTKDFIKSSGETEYL